MAILLLIGVVIGFAIALITPPEGLNQQSMRVLGILGGTIFYLITGVLPEMVTVILMGLLFVMLAAIPMGVAFGGFGTTVAWLFLVAMALAFALGNSGLLRRISLWLASVMPANYFGQMLATFLSGLFVIGPTVPSLAGKMALFTPPIQGVTRSMGFADNSKASIGLVFAAFIAPYILASVAFMTGGTPTLAIFGALPEPVRQGIPWVMWTVYALPMTVVIGVGMFLVLLKMYSPGRIVVNKDGIRADLAKLGPLSSKERTVAILVILLFILFITSPLTKIDVAHSAVAIMLAMLILGVLSTKDLVAAVNWPIWIFVAFVIQIGPVMARVNIDKWLGTALTPVFQPLAGNLYLFFLAFMVVALLLRMLSPSISAAGIILLVAISPVAVKIGINPFLLLLAYATVGNHWIMPHLNATGYLVQYTLLEGKYYTHAEGRKLCYIFLAISVLAVMISIPYWQMVGLIK
jgi:DASS family divalent anion:Na+ symporter